MSDDRSEQGTVQIALRIAPDLRERIKVAAEANNRSVNKELTATLEEKYPAPRDLKLLVAVSELLGAIAACDDPEHPDTRSRAAAKAFLEASGGGWPTDIQFADDGYVTVRISTSKPPKEGATLEQPD